MTLREKLIVLRDKAGITQMALAHQLGVSRQAVTRWESGDTAPSMEKLKALAKIYDVSLDWLCNDTTYGVEQQKPASAVSADEICDANISSTKKKGIQINRRSTIALAICIGVIVLAYMWLAAKNKKTEMKDQKSTDVKYDVIDLPSQNDNRFVFEWED